MIINAQKNKDHASENYQVHISIPPLHPHCREIPPTKTIKKQQCSFNIAIILGAKSLIPPISYHFPWVFIGFSEIPWVFHRCSRTGSHMASNWPQRCQADNPGEFLLAGKMMYHQMIFIGVYSDSGT